MDKCSTDQLSISWHDSAWILINQTNVLDYFSERSNPFYDNKCNNEQIKMQRLSMDQLNNMVGNEYILLHVQEPILYVIRKQYRHSPTQATPIADYYIIAGVVYQAPDLCSVINSRLLNTVHNLQSAFDEAHSFSKYHPSKGYWWDFKNQEEKDKPENKEKKKKKEEPSSLFQRQRVDMLLAELGKKYPPQFIAPSQPEPKEEPAKVEVKTEVKTEKQEDKNNTSMKPPPEKRAKLMR
ncbi:mediator of RNA polymerase II transcription subunit 6-like isoform X1 [Gigantopelta aegis]|uniref:mediator of RNA polymerase II transcription subunit 6-like isoform X1 n=1 Tax=Gigantopelta aegis TaxID=1735272 RepID=UPI001B8898D8|nr:mediator of RNA polymerase II transcription subunit 6-like isoform X1 [Gigantopelta aegis]